MHKSLVALVGAAGIGFAALAAPGTANAQCFGCAVGAGILGGVIAGTVIGSAIANSPPPGYYPPPAAYVQLAPGCHWGHRRVWVEGVGYQWRTVQVCP